nr:SPOR domain-containing protein [uncultured Shimia sp.]
MKLTRVIAIGVIASSLGLGAAVHAQSLKNVETPSEFPPASYKGKQYVDSKGCVYIRAGVDGNVTWVPRMTRNRKVVCGYKPTIAGAKPSTGSAPKLNNDVVFIEPAAKPKPPTTIFGTTAPATAAATSTASTKPKAKSTTKSTAKAASAPKTTSVKKASTSSAKSAPKATPKPRTTQATAAKTATKPASTTATTTTSATSARRSTTQAPRASGHSSPCRSASGASAMHGKYAVRCGPQSELPYTPGTGKATAPAPVIRIQRQGSEVIGSQGVVVGQIVKEGEVSSDVRVVPRHVYENQFTHLPAPTVPKGYRRVFDDGRLNPHRAEQTFAGKAAMDAAWSETLPRTMIHRRTGETIVMSSKSSSYATSAPFEKTPQLATQSTSRAPNAPVVSTRSAPVTKSLRLSGAHYVQAGTYQDAQSAQAAAQKLQKRGLPVKIGRYTKNGETRRMVLAGPFGSQTSGEKALAVAQKSGFSGAFLRD